MMFKRHTTCRRNSPDNATIAGLENELRAFVDLLPEEKKDLLISAINSLSGYETLREEKRTVKLPFAVGNTVYVISRSGTIVDGVFQYVYINKNGSIRMYCKNTALGCKLSFKSGAVNRTVFASYESANRALLQNPGIVGEDLVPIQ